MNKQERNVFFFTRRTKFLQQRQSLVLLAVVSVGILSSSAPLALEVEGLQEAVELDSEVYRTTRAKARRRCTIVRRDTCAVYVAS